MTAKTSAAISSRAETLSLEKAANMLLEECRMVLPGLQALFGFQLVAVFSATFKEELSGPEQFVHLTAMLFAVVAAALIMAPAAFHRRQGVDCVTREFLAVSTRLMHWSMFPLALAIALDLYLIGRVIGDAVTGATLAVLALAAFYTLWGVLPASQRLQRFIARD